MAKRSQQVEELFHEALSRKPPERELFLTNACSSDPSLRAEVESLISAYEQPGSFLENPAYEVAADLIDVGPAQSLVGRCVGHYELTALVGRGGMGDVYLAYDKKLDRRVALKLLPHRYTADEVRLRRFVLEARAASSLNHPNIITIHEIGTAHEAEQSVHFIAAEFIDGVTLRKRLSIGQIGVSEAIDISLQVASALSTAHAAGIVHRDIKPENIMLRPDGYVKVLDFGLAKLTEKQSPVADSRAATRANVDTDPGIVMGTVSYMSPEQARGQSVDARSDIFSLGVVIYEMVAGRLPFEGDNAADVIASILKTEPPPLSDVPADPTDQLWRLVKRSLSKNKEDRFQTSEELLAELRVLRKELEHSDERTRAENMQPLPLSPARVGLLSSRLIVFLVVAVIAVAALLWLTIQPTEPAIPLTPSPLFRWKNQSGEEMSDPKFSPDGQSFAFSSAEGKRSEIIWTMPIGGGDPVAITNDQWRSWSPIWSRDGQQIAFSSKREGKIGIYSVPAIGGSETLLTTVEGGTPFLTYWSRDGSTIYYELKNNLFALDSGSGKTSRLTNFDLKTVTKGFSISPGEDFIAYSDNKDEEVNIWIAPIRGGAPIQVTHDPAVDWNPYWLPDGRRIAYSSDRNGIYQIWVTDVDGQSPRQITPGDDSYEISDVLSTGTRLLCWSLKDESTIWGLEVDTGEEPQITSSLDLDLWPDISPDGRWIAFQRSKAPRSFRGLDHSAILVKPLGPQGEEVQIATDGFRPKWLPDSRTVSFLRQSSTGDITNIWTATAEGARQQVTSAGISRPGYNKLPFNLVANGEPSWSHDGQRVVYCSKRSGHSNVWTASADGSNETNVSTNTKKNVVYATPFWSADGRLIAFLSLTTSTEGAKPIWRLLVADDENPKVIYSSDSYLRLLGWSPSGNKIFIAQVHGMNMSSSAPTGVSLIEVSATDRIPRTLAELESAYAVNIRLSPDGTMIAFTSRRNSKDNIWLVPAIGGAPTKLTANSDQGLYYSSLEWAPNSKAIYYSRQTRWSVVSMIDNFR